MKLHFALVVLLFTAISLHAESVQLAAPGTQPLPVVVSEQASDATRQAAAELADYLGRISGSKFEVTTGDGTRGVAIGAAEQFPALGYADRFDPTDPTQQEQYILRSHVQGLHVVGATDVAVSHAVWDLLHRLGHRQYLPNAHWEIVPRRDTLAIDVDDFESPSFIQRRLWNGGGYVEHDKAPHDRWYTRNRIAYGFKLGASHIYDRIIMDNRAEFEAHPEYLALRNGQREPLQRENNKFCLSNPEVRKIAVEWAIGYLKKHPNIAGVPMEPSDGTNWCEGCAPCDAMGSVTDRVVTLANETAAALEEAFDKPRYVGILAYGEHSPPPTIPVHPRVVVSVAKGFIRGGYTFEELIRNWGGTGVMLGVYDYLGVTQWSWCLPGRGRSSRSRYAARDLAWLYDHGVRLYTGETEANWGASGPNPYMVSRVLWDVTEASRVDEMRREFFDLCFGSAAGTMQRFYDLIDGENNPLLSRDLVGRMFRLVDQAMRESSDPAVHARLRDLAIYCRYVELYLDYNTAEGEARQANFERLIRFIWQTRDTLMVHTREIHRNLGYVDKRVTMEEHQRYKYPDAQNPWKQNPPLTEADIDAFVRAGVEHNALFEFEPVAFSTDLAPATPLKLTSNRLGTFGGGTQNFQQFYTWVEQAPATIELTCTGGLIAHYRDRGDVRIKLFRAGEADDIPLDEARVPPDGKPYAIKLRTNSPGLHRIELTDGGDRSALDWPQGMPMTFWSDSGTTISYPLAWTLYFYVPRGTTRVAGYCSHPSGTMVDAEGAARFDFTTLPGAGFFDVPVPPGQDGKLWRFERCYGQRLLMTVPPALARSADELLLPADVVARDAR